MGTINSTSQESFLNKIKNLINGSGATVAITASGGVITSTGVNTTPPAGGSGYPPSSTFLLNVNGGTGVGGVVVATTTGGVITGYSTMPAVAGTGYANGPTTVATIPVWSWTAALYNVDYEPSIADTITNYTSNLPNVNTIPLNNWGVVVLDVNDAATMIHPAITFTQSTGSSQGNVYGYYVYDNTNTLIYASTFPNGPLTIAVGLPIIVVPQFTFFDVDQCGNP